MSINHKTEMETPDQGDSHCDCYKCEAGGCTCDYCKAQPNTK
jgi:hypothetical protein